MEMLGDTTFDTAPENKMAALPNKPPTERTAASIAGTRNSSVAGNRKAIQ